MKIEQYLTKEEKKLIGDAIGSLVEREKGIRPIVLLGLAQYATDFYLHDAAEQVGLGDVDETTEEMLDAALEQLPKERDPLFDKAVSAAKHKKGMGKPEISASYFRVKFGITHGRASALIDQLEEAGIISKSERGKPRRVL